MSRLIDSLDEEGIIITKHGRPVARLVPVESKASELLGVLAGKLKVKCDILTTGLDWNAEP